MRAVVFDERLRYDPDYPTPEPSSGWARIRVHTVGICGTDLELTRGYAGFRGVLGHEFVGTVDQCGDAAWIGRRVVGGINIACGTCAMCARGLARHCPNRTVLGIVNQDGCMADYCVLPVVNLVEVPSGLSDDQAVFTEPLAAACEVLEQLDLTGEERAVVLGDGRLGVFCAWVLSTVLETVTLKGHHQDKLDQADWNGVACVTSAEDVAPGADLVVDATGSPEGLAEAVSYCRPRGTIVLKSTVAASYTINLAPVVIDEQTILGSRCGRMEDAFDLLARYPDLPLERLITAHYPLEQAETAFRRAVEPDAIKILLQAALTT